MTQTLFDKIQADLKQSMLAKETLRTSVLRLLVSAIRYYEIEKGVQTLSDEDVMQALKRQVKQRRDSIESYEKAGRTDLVDKERQELALLETYMPKALSVEELTEIVKAAIAESGATTKAQTGLAMKAAMAKVQGRADGKQVNQIVLKLLV